MSDNRAVAPPFAVSVFKQPVISKSRVILKGEYSGIEKEDLAVSVKGSGAIPIAIAEDGTLSIDGKCADFRPHDVVQMVVSVPWINRFAALVRIGELDFRIKKRLQKSSFFARGDKRSAEIPSHLFELIGDENVKSTYFVTVTFVPDPDLEEWYIPHKNSGIIITEILDPYVLRLWNVRLVTQGGVTRLEINYKDVARPDGLTGFDGDDEKILKYAEENSHIFF